MAGPLATVAASIRRELESLQVLTHKLDRLEARIGSVPKELDTLKEKVNGLTGKASPHLINAMAKKLGIVRRAADAVRKHVTSKRKHTPHQYLISLTELAEYLEGKLDEAITHFGEVERRNPSALRRSQHDRTISIALERGSDNSSRHQG